MDDRIWTLIIVLLLGVVVATIEGTFVGAAAAFQGKGKLAAWMLLLVSIPFTVLGVVAAGFANLLLWNLVRPTFDLPEVDLITMIALGWLSGHLIRGIIPQRVRIVKEVE